MPARFAALPVTARKARASFAARAARRFMFRRLANPAAASPSRGNLTWRRARWSWIFPRLATRPPRFTPDPMLARLVRESFTRNPRRKLLTGAALVVGMAVATATLTIALEVGDRLAHEFRSFGANLLVPPQADTLPVEIGGADFRPVEEGAYLHEADLGKLKTIFWRHNIEGFTPFLDVPAYVDEAGGEVTVIGTWYQHGVAVPDGTRFQTGLRIT